MNSPVTERHCLFMLVVFHSVWVCGEGRTNPSALQWTDPSGKDLNTSTKEFKLTEVVCFCKFSFCLASSCGWVIFQVAHFQTLLPHEGNAFSDIWLRDDRRWIAAVRTGCCSSSCVTNIPELSGSTWRQFLSLAPAELSLSQNMSLPPAGSVS